MDSLNVVNDTPQAVVEPAQAGIGESGADGGTPEVRTDTEVTNRTQSAAENSGFRKLRLENERCKAELNELKGKLNGLSELESAREKSRLCLNALVDDRMSRDLEAVRRLDPRVTDLSELGDDFIRLIENGIGAEVAYGAVKKATAGAKSPKPPATGTVGYSEDTSTRFFSSRELDRLTPKDLENPATFKKAMESLKKL